MAKNNDLVMWAIVGILAFAVFSGGQSGTTTTTTTTSGGSGVDLCTVVSPSASFTAQTMFSEATGITASVRIIKKNGGSQLKDLGYKQTNGGTLSTAPNGEYNLYWAVNSSTYYPEVERYTAPCQDAVDNKVGVLCTIDTAPTVTIYNEDGQVQTISTNKQAIGASDTRDVKVRVRVATEKCYGSPDSDVAGTNAICFKYNTSFYKSVTAGTAMATPYPISSVYAATGTDIACYQLPKLKNNEIVDIPVQLKSTSSDPSVNGRANITIFLDDVTVDLNADNLAEIYGFSDEDNNALGATAVKNALGIQIS